MTRRRWFTSTAVVVFVGVFGLLASLGLQGESSSFDLPPIGLPSETSFKARVLGPTERYAVLAEHTLFSPTRRPTPPPKQAPVPVVATTPLPPLAPPPTTLLAVLIDSDHRAAILRLATGGTSTVVEGDVLGGWTVVQVAEDRVLFRSTSSNTTATFPMHGLGASQTALQPSGDMANPTPMRRRR